MTDASSSTSYPTNMTNLTDLQLRQTITQLSNAANNPTNQFQHYVSPAPQQSTSKVPQQVVAAPVYQPPPQPVAPVQVAPPLPPNPPRHPLPVVSQALHSTYASRLRTGTTLLVQPVLTQPSAAAGNTRASTRRGGMINYAEPGSGDEFPDAGAIESDDSDFVASGGMRTTLRTRRMGTGMSVFHSGSGMSTPQPQQRRSTPMQNDKGELDQSYLGMIPPSRFIKAKTVAPTAHEYPTPDMLEAQAQTRASLVPIRVEFETDTLRIRDCFVWNLNETLIKPESFAKVFCADLDLPSVPWAETVANQIRAQIEDHEGVASMDIGVDNAIDSSLDPHVAAEAGEEVPECRVILSIDVQIATYHLLDHIEWDLLSPLTPEAFALQLCTELGLSGEALPLISHAIHEELIKHKKDAIEWGVIGGDKEAEGMKDKTGLGMGWGRTKGPKVLQSVWREWTEAEEFRTRFEVLTAEEVERREIEKERASRRLRRETSKFQTTRTRRR
ncbi:hypothetical protein BD769DRAFT_1358172 [Suillus cothurnatus]|nr:hypothetical protein BD769DRAFT_1358172 [Suillus cothurnatus]